MTAADSPWEAQVEELRERALNPAPALNRIADEVIMPALGEHYLAAGLKVRSGMMFNAITKRSAPGNRVNVVGSTVTVGIDYGTPGSKAGVPYAKFVLEGHGEIVTHYFRALHWIDPDTGKDVFVKRVRPQPGHAVYYLTPEDLEKAQVIAVECMGG